MKREWGRFGCSEGLFNCKKRHSGKGGPGVISSEKAQS